MFFGCGEAAVGVARRRAGRALRHVLLDHVAEDIVLKGGRGYNSPARLHRQRQVIGVVVAEGKAIARLGLRDYVPLTVIRIGPIAGHLVAGRGRVAAAVAVAGGVVAVAVRVGGAAVPRGRGQLVRRVVAVGERLAVIDLAGEVVVGVIRQGVGGQRRPARVGVHQRRHVAAAVIAIDRRRHRRRRAARAIIAQLRDLLVGVIRQPHAGHLHAALAIGPAGQDVLVVVAGVFHPTERIRDRRPVAVVVVAERQAHPKRLGDAGDPLVRIIGQRVCPLVVPGGDDVAVRVVEAALTPTPAQNDIRVVKDRCLPWLTGYRSKELSYRLSDPTE